MTDRVSQPPQGGVPLLLTHPDNLLEANDHVPGAYCCGVIGQFGMIGNFQSGFGETGPFGDAGPPFQRFSVRWCAIGDLDDWPTPDTADARAKQAGQETLPAEFGWVTAIAGNDFYGYIFQERAITKATYVGGDVVFSFDTFERGRGCIRSGRMAQIDENSAIFESERGVHVITNDVIQDVGFGNVDDSYF